MCLECLKCVSEVSRECLEVSRECPECLGVSQKCLESVSRVSRVVSECLGCVSDVSQKCLDVSLKCLLESRYVSHSLEGVNA